MTDREPARGVLDALDEAICEVAKNEYANLSRGLEPVDCAKRVNAAFESLSRLQRGKQPDYTEWDSLFYLSWYQPRQVHLVYEVLRQCWGRGIPSPLLVVDVGCGADAVKTSLAILAASGSKPASDVDIVVSGRDTSKAMRDLGEKLWTALRTAAAAQGQHDLVDAMKAMDASYSAYRLHSSVTRFTYRWLTCVHAVYKENLGEIRGKCDQVRDRLGSSLMELMTSDVSKSSYVDCLIGEGAERLQVCPCWSGHASDTTAWRKSLLGRPEGRYFDGQVKKYLQRNVEWKGFNPIDRDAVRVRRHPF